MSSDELLLSAENDPKTLIHEIVTLLCPLKDLINGSNTKAVPTCVLLFKQNLEGYHVEIDKVTPLSVH